MTKGWLLLILVLGLLLAFSIAVGSATASPGILYVKPSASGSGNCSNWANACTLQTALGAATTGDEIWVAEGTHKPTSGTDRTATFQLVNGVEVYGGFAGTESSRAQRDWQTNVTVLSGDIDDNDITDPNDVITTTANITGTNSYHVVTSSSVTETCMLDGFTITGGNANGEWPDWDGGGMKNDGTSSPTLTNVTFGANFAENGGGMSNRNSSSPTLSNVTFDGNFASWYGGGMLNWEYSSPTLTNVTFADNSVYSEGGAMYNYSHSSPALTNVTFSGNSAFTAGGMYNNNSSTPTLVNVAFSGNSATYSGGGMCNYESSPTLTNVTFSANSADEGGGMYNLGSSPTLTNSILWGNTASEGAQISNGFSSMATISYSLVEGSGGSGTGWDTSLGADGGGNIDADPQFVDADGPDDIVGTLDDNLRLSATSPAIDAGDNSAVPADALDLDADGDTAETVPFDLDGCPRILMDTVDMGAYEWPLCLALTKTVINDDGGTAVAGDFQAYLEGIPVPWGVGQWVISGTYTVSETVEAGYSASAWSGDCAPDGTITLTLDDHATCSVTNDDIAPTVTLTKTVINDDDGAATVSDFQAYLDRALVPWGVPQPVLSGTHTASESVLPGYVPTMWGGDCNEDGTITLNVGEDAVCSTTNDDTLHSYIPLVLKNYGS